MLRSVFQEQYLLEVQMNLLSFLFSYVSICINAFIYDKVHYLIFCMNGIFAQAGLLSSADAETSSLKS